MPLQELGWSEQITGVGAEGLFLAAVQVDDDGLPRLAQDAEEHAAVGEGLPALGPHAHHHELIAGSFEQHRLDKLLECPVSLAPHYVELGDKLKGEGLPLLDDEVIKGGDGVALVPLLPCGLDATHFALLEVEQMHLLPRDEDGVPEGVVEGVDHAVLELREAMERPLEPEGVRQ